MQIPLLDLKAQYAPIRAEILQTVTAVLDSQICIGGPKVAELEAAVASLSNCKYGIGVSSGTDALLCSLMALGIGPGDEVITSPFTFFASAGCISRLGARPVFVDIEPHTYNIDPQRIEAAITSRTKAVIPIHLFGQMADMDPILKFGQQHGVAVIEDAAQAHGAEYKNRRAGSIGEIGCFSFYPGKNLGALGEAGAVVTNSLRLADKVRVLRDHGQTRKYHHTVVGWNCRMDAIQAACLAIKLRHLERGNDLRRKHAARYSSAFKDVEEIVPPFEADYARHVYHVYAVRVQDRNEVIRHLEEKGIGCGVHYPVPVHLQEAYAGLDYERGAFPVSEQIANEFVSLPMFPELSEAQIDFVIETVKESVATGVMA